MTIFHPTRLLAVAVAARASERTDPDVRSAGSAAETVAETAAATESGTRPETCLDRQAFQRFYERTSAPLRRYLQRVCADPGRAEDVFQESYVRLINRPDLDLDDERLRSYLFRTATNLLRDHWRRAGREREGLSSLFTVRRGRSAPPPSGARLDLDAALATLAVRDRAMLWLAYVEGYGHRDIAAMLGLRAGSVRVLLFRLRQRLADRLDPEAGKPDAARSGGEA